MYSKDRILEIDKAILELTNPKIDYSLFKDYKDFISNHYVIAHYKFEFQFTDHLIEIIEYTFRNKGRFNRAKLLEVLNSYIYAHKAKLSLQQRERIFDLIRQCFENKEIAKSARNPAYHLLVNLPLFPEAENWLCYMADNYDPATTRDKLYFISRLLRYPANSEAISNWVSENYHDDKLRLRRAEATAWMVNNNPNYVIDNKTLIDDFEYMNIIDKTNIKERVNMLLSLYVESDHESDINFDNFNETPGPHNLVKRPYAYITYHYTLNSRPDFYKLRKYFYNNIDRIKKQTMLWAIAYSHLPKKNKVKLLKQYYRPDLFASTFKIAKKYGLVEMLKWLKTQPVEIKKNEYHVELNNEYERKGYY